MRTQSVRICYLMAFMFSNFASIDRWIFLNEQAELSSGKFSLYGCHLNKKKQVNNVYGVFGFSVSQFVSIQEADSFAVEIDIRNQLMRLKVVLKDFKLGLRCVWQDYAFEMEWKVRLLGIVGINFEWICPPHRCLL